MIGGTSHCNAFCAFIISSVLGTSDRAANHCLPIQDSAICQHVAHMMMWRCCRRPCSRYVARLRDRVASSVISAKRGSVRNKRSYPTQPRGGTSPDGRLYLSCQEDTDRCHPRARFEFARTP